MTCESAKNLVEPYLDDELDATLSAQMQEHLSSCGDCTGEHTRLLALRAAIRNEAPYYRAPAHLTAQIRTALGREERQSGGSWRWMALAASLLLAVSLAWNVSQFQSRPTLAQDVLASHIRSLMGAHLTDVPSTDQHTVKPWFNGKLDYSPDVKDFAAEGFPLVGGRLDYVGGRAVAALVYQRRQHIINLFTWPSTAPADLAELSRNGYHAIHWTKAGMTWWAVSDVGEADLHRFAALNGN